MIVRGGLFSLQPKASLRVCQTKTCTEKGRKPTGVFYFLTLTLPRHTSISSWQRWGQKCEEGRCRGAMMHMQGPRRATQWEPWPPSESRGHPLLKGQPWATELGNNGPTVFSSDILEQAIPSVPLTTSHDKTSLLTRRISITFPLPLVLKSASLPAVLWAGEARPHEMLRIAGFWIDASGIKLLKTFSVSWIQDRWL